MQGARMVQAAWRTSFPVNNAHAVLRIITFMLFFGGGEIFIFNVLFYLFVVEVELLFDFEDFSVDEEAIPEALQDVPDEALLAVEEAEFEEVTVCEVGEGTEEEGHLDVFYF